MVRFDIDVELVDLLVHLVHLRSGGQLVHLTID